MAEVKINQLPVMLSASFTDNDNFLVVDDGGARLLPRPTLQAWMMANVQGEQGVQGVQGVAGKDGYNGYNGANGKNGLSAYQVAVGNGYTGEQQQWLQSLIGATGAVGSSGTNGWSPVLKIVFRGNDTVLQISDWIGGSGTKPITGQYLSSLGLVSNIDNADNVRGVQGVQGIQGVQGVQGEKGISGKTISDISFNTDRSLSITHSDGTFATSTNTLPINGGWATYKDSQYTDVAPYILPANTQSVAPNNATYKVEYLPSYQPSFYDVANQKYLLKDTSGFYSVRIRFKTSDNTQQSFINVSMSKDTAETPYSEDRFLRGDSQIQNFNFETVMYGDSALANNGLTIRIKSYDRAISIYDFEVTIAKLVSPEVP